MNEKDLVPYFPLTMVGKTKKDRITIKEALSEGFFLWTTKDGKVLRNTDFVYIADIIPLKKGERPDWSSLFNLDIDFDEIDKL